MGESIHEFFREPRNRELVERLRAAGLKFDHPKTERKAGAFDARVISLASPVMVIGVVMFGSPAGPPAPPEPWALVRV